MHLKRKLSRGWRERATAAALTAVVGLLFHLSPAGLRVENLSFDLTFLLKPTRTPEGVVIIYMDEKSFLELKQEPKNWDRLLHARLLDRLTADRSKLVVFDVWLTDPGSTNANEELVRAIQRNGKVVLAAILDTETRPGLSGLSLGRPLSQFLEAAANWGVAAVAEDRRSVIRRHYPNGELGPSLPWVAAVAAGVDVTKAPAGDREERWLNYYGPHGTIQSVSYCEVTNQPAGYFQDKVVFVGARPKSLYAFEDPEEFRTPYTRFGGGLFPGVEIMATAFLNLQHNDWMRRLSPWTEILLLVFSGALFGFGLNLWRPLVSVAVSLTGILAISFLAMITAWHQHVWFSWMLLAGVQVPCALGWSVFLHVRRHWRQKGSESGAVPEAVAGKGPGGTRRIPDIPDHELLRPVGTGSYGEVWLARNAIGLFHAVKIVYRERFNSDAPYEREFKGMQKYMPISLGHTGLVHLLHVGRNDQVGYFLYIMEAGDDELVGKAIEPKSYSPRNLAKELRKRGRLSVSECVSLGLQLTEALEYLHQNKLIHRDIKPANIIYVKGVPKLADIGLVTDLGDQGDASYLGTEGYIAPEGPGTATADVYGLGKVLYEACMGRRFPDVPTSLIEKFDDPHLLELNRILLHACEADPKKRYQSAAQMRADLLDLQARLGTKATRT